MQLTSKSDVILQRTRQRKKKKTKVSVHMELQKSTESHSKPKEGSMAGGTVVMTSEHITETQTNTANIPDRETSGTEQRNQQRCQNTQLNKKDSLFKRAVTARLDISL